MEIGMVKNANVSMDGVEIFVLWNYALKIAMETVTVQMVLAIVLKDLLVIIAKIKIVGLMDIGDRQNVNVILDGLEKNVMWNHVIEIVMIMVLVITEHVLVVLIILVQLVEIKDV